LASLNLDDHLDFNSIIERKRRHRHGRACVLSNRLAENSTIKSENPFITFGWCQANSHGEDREANWLPAPPRTVSPCCEPM